MKRTMFLVLLALLSLAGCRDTGGVIDGEDADVDPWPPQYLLSLEVVDQNGQNVLAGYESYEIDGASAEVSCYDESGKLLYTEDTRYALNSINLVSQRFEGVSYFNVIVWAHNAREDIITLHWMIKCKRVFGDENSRKIEVHWGKAEGYIRKCMSFMFEGNTYVPELKNGLWTARVIVNR